MPRMRVSDAARKAASIVPDPSAPRAPAHEDAGDPWDDDSTYVEDATDSTGGTATVDRGYEIPGEDVAIEDVAPAITTPRGARSWGEVVHTMITVDPVELTQRLQAELMLGKGATEYGAVLAIADRAERNYLDAVRLSRYAKLQDEECAQAVDKKLEVLRSAAKEELEKEVAASYDEKLKKTTKKAPTIQDIEDRMIASWPDEVYSQRRRKSEMHAGLRITEGLVEAWKSRCATLRVMLERVAPGRPRG